MIELDLIIDFHRSSERQGPEIELYHTYQDHFSYGFYVARIGSHP